MSTNVGYYTVFCQYLVDGEREDMKVDVLAESEANAIEQVKELVESFTETFDVSVSRFEVLSIERKSW